MGRSGYGGGGRGSVNATQMLPYTLQLLLHHRRPMMLAANKNEDDLNKWFGVQLQNEVDYIV